MQPKAKPVEVPLVDCGLVARPKLLVRFVATDATVNRLELTGARMAASEPKPRPPRPTQRFAMEAPAQGRSPPHRLSLRIKDVSCESMAPGHTETDSKGISATSFPARPTFHSKPSLKTYWRRAGVFSRACTWIRLSAPRCVVIGNARFSAATNPSTSLVRKRPPTRIPCISGSTITNLASV